MDPFLTAVVYYLEICSQGRAVGFEKGGADLDGDPPKKTITRPDPPKKSKSPQFWATLK